jgi:hypothetical protein
VDITPHLARGIVLGKYFHERERSMDVVNYR